MKIVNTLITILLTILLLNPLTAIPLSAQENHQQETAKLKKEATACIQQGDFDTAKDCLEKALAIDPHDMMSRYLFASIHVFENYDKQTYQVEMRDGIKLHTQVYTPKDTSITYPIIYCRSPYSSFAYGEGFQGYFGFLGPGPKFIEEKFIFVVQDVRGRFMSEGDFEVMRPNTADWNDPKQADESTDAWDSIDWMLGNVKNHNGRVGIWGGSYLAYYGALALVNAHPALKAVSLESPVAEVFLGDDYHHNGALYLAYTFIWLNNFGFDRSEGPSAKRPARAYKEKIDDLYSFFLEAGPLKNINEKYFKHKVSFWNDILEHGTYDQFWKSRTLGHYLKNIDGPAVLIAGSWFDDQDLYGTLHTYRALEQQNPGLSCNLVMGCWNHAPWWEQKTGPWGAVDLPAGTTGDVFRDEILISFFKTHLKQQGDCDLPEVLAFESGTNVMKEYSAWPPPNAIAKDFYFGANGTLPENKPHSFTPQFEEFVSDPNNPILYHDRPLQNWDADFMHADQRFAHKRDDVLCYEGEVLGENLTFAGPMKVDLYVSTTGTDADWIVKVIDVYPEGSGELAGYQMLVRGDIMRSKFRNSFEKPEPMVPGEITHIEFELPDVNHTFLKGHKIMIQVQSSWFPLFDRNPQQFVNIYSASTEDFKSATHRIYRSKDYPSGISVLIIPLN